MNKRIAVALISLAFLTACSPPTDEEKQATVERYTKLVGVVDGCRIWEVYNQGGTNPFLARCPEGTADVTWQTGGKVKTTQFTLGEN